MFNLYESLGFDIPTPDSIVENLYFDIHFRNQDHNNVKYNNISDDYNGVMILSDEFYIYKNKMLYDNGFYIHNDYNVTDLPPVYMMALFPGRHFPHHHVYMTFDSSGRYYYKRTYKAKFKNITKQDLTNEINSIKYYKENVYDILSDVYKEDAIYTHDNRLIYKDIMYLDYIDFRCHMIVNGSILLNDIDYEILAPNVIRFKRKPFELPIDKDTIEVIVQYDDLFDEVLMKFPDTSRLYKLYNNDKVIDHIFDIDYDDQYIKDNVYDRSFNFEDDYVREYVRKFLYPQKYPKDVQRGHMFLTKYFSTEAVVQDNATQYGINWKESLLREFPEYVTHFELTKDIDLDWNKIEAHDYTWDEIDARGGLWNIKDKKILKSFHTVFTNIFTDILQYPERLYFTDDIDRNKFQYESLQMKEKIDEDPSFRFSQEYHDFCMRWTMNIYYKDKEYNPVELIRGYIAPPMPRVVTLPERDPLNHILTNHAVGVNYIRSRLLTDMGNTELYRYDTPQEQAWRHAQNEIRNINGLEKLGKEGPQYRYWDIYKFFHNNQLRHTKISPVASKDDLLRGTNILSYWLDVDSLLSPNIPINYCILPKQVDHEDDLWYMETWFNKYMDLYPKGHAATPYKPSTKDKLYRFINIVPDIGTKDHPILTALKCEYRATKDEDNKFVSIRTLLKAKNIDIPADVIGYIYYNEKLDTNITIPIDMNLRHREELLCIGNLEYKPLTLYPIYKNNRLVIDLGPLVDDDNIEDNKDTDNVLVTFDIPKKIYPDIPHYPKLNSVITKQDLINKLNTMYPNHDDVLSILDRWKNPNRVGDDIKLYSITIDETKATEGIEIYKEEYTLGNDDLMSKITSDTTYWTYYSFTPTSRSIDGKWVRIFEMDKPNASILVKSPDFILPAKYNIKDDKYKMLTGALTSTFVDDHRYIVNNFIDYVIRDMYVRNHKNRLENKNESYTFSDMTYLEIKDTLKKINAYDLITYENGIKDTLDLTDIGYSLYSTRILSATLDVYFLLNRTIQLRSKVKPELTSVYKDLPPYVNVDDPTNICLWNYIHKNENKYVIWTSDGQDDQGDGGYNLNELVISDSQPDVNTLNYISGVTFNALQDTYPIYTYDKYEDVYELKATYNTNDIKGTYKAITNLIMSTPNKVFYTDKPNGEKIRIIGIEALHWDLYNKYMNIINTEEENDWDKLKLAIQIKHNPEGTLDINALSYAFTKTTYDLTDEMILKWKQAYGRFDFMPKYMTKQKFIDAKYIDIGMKHPGFDIEIAIEDVYHNYRFVRNRVNDTTLFPIIGDRNFNNIVATDFSKILEEYVKTVPIETFRKSMNDSFVAIELIHPQLKETIRLDGNKVFENNIHNLFDALCYAGHYEADGARRMSQIPIIRLIYKLTDGYLADSIIETWDKDKWEKYQFGDKNVIGFRLGIGNSIMMAEYHTYSDGLVLSND